MFLASAHDLSGWNLYEKVDCLLTFRRQQGNLPTEVRAASFGVPARSLGTTVRRMPRVESHQHPPTCTLQVVHCALQCTYYALLWQIVAATDRLPPQVGKGPGGGQVQVCGPGEMGYQGDQCPSLDRHLSSRGQAGLRV